ncbi:MAG: WD40/YVTN/BNR-like repeat-containing protein [Pyrinomonadaceae bacterium]
MKIVSGVGQKLFFAVFSLMFFISAATAQGGWNLIRRGGAGDLVSVYFTSSDRGFVGGDGGYLAMTSDGGRNWTRQNLNTTDTINEIYFRSDDNGYVLAGRRIYLTKDGGKTWRENVIVNKNDYKNLTPEFLSVRFSDKKRGWIVGSLSNQREEVVDSLVLQTTDGGETWSRVIVPTKEELYHLDFTNNDNGWIVGNRGLILNTRDGGQTWQAQSSGTTSSLYNVDFRDSDNGVAVGGDGIILRTKNGGINWSKISSGINKSLLRVNFVSDKNGWIVGGGGTILRTDDKGRTWTRQDSQTQDSLYGLFMEKKYGWAVGKKGIILQYQK